MKSPVFSALATIALAVCMSGPASAQIRLDRPAGGGMGGGGGGGAGGGQQGNMIDKITPDLAVRLLQSVGFKGGEPIRMNNDQAMGLKMDLNGTPVGVILQNCEGGGCASYTIFMDFGRQNISSDFINKFNGNNRFSKLFVSNNGNAILQLDGQLSNGVSPGNVAVNGALFAAAFKTLMSN